MTKIGILLVHGIGDQGRFEHLHDVVRRFVAALVKEHGSRNVSIEMPGLPGDATVIARDGEAEIHFDFNEMWWRDLAQRPSLAAKIGFWLWAVSLPGTKGYFSKPDQGRANPACYGGRNDSLRWRSRLGLLLRTTYIFVLLSPLAMIMRLINVIPGVQTIPFMHSVFTYLSSVQLYQQRRSSQPGTLVDFDQSRRISIQRKMANLIVDMAERGYDRWYVFGHSLGSVIAFKALMYDDVAFARFMSYRRWNHPAFQRWKAPGASPGPAGRGDESAAGGRIDYVDCPACPVWMPPGARVNTQEIFAGLRGLVTYGSPLETFANTWPAVVQLNCDVKLPSNFEWINLYDPTDVVAPRLESFGNAATEYPISPINCPVDSAYMMGKSHLNYFSLPTASRPHRVIIELLHWMKRGDGSFRGADHMKEDHILLRRFALVAQSLFILVAGGLLWPMATLSTLGFVQVLVGAILNITSSALRNFDSFSEWLRRTSSGFMDQAYNTVLILSPSSDRFENVVHIGTIYGLMIAVVGSASLLHFLRDSWVDKRDARDMRRADAARHVPLSATPPIRVDPVSDTPSRSFADNLSR